MSEITTPQPEKDLTRVDAMGESSDSPTASSALPDASVRQEESHSPLPWYFDEQSIEEVAVAGTIGSIESADGWSVVSVWSDAIELPAKANAEYIVTACNAYPALIAERDALREALQALVDETVRCDVPGIYGVSRDDDVMVKARKALLSSCPATGEGR